jgi:hypothetical protein
MPAIAPPIPIKRLENRIEGKSGAKNEPSAPKPKSAIPNKNKDLCMNLTVKKPMIRPTTRPTKEPTVKIWLATPTVTLSDEATFTMALLKKTSNEAVKNMLSSNTSINNRFLSLVLGLAS